jgi:hypothetical protein
MFFARYVRKAHSGSAIKSELRNNEGLLFVDIISLSDIAFVISVIKNGWDVWDQKIRMKELGTAVHGEREVKLRPLFIEGTGKKKSKVRVCGVMREWNTLSMRKNMEKGI